MRLRERARPDWTRGLVLVATLVASCGRGEERWAEDLTSQDPFVRALAALALSEQPGEWTPAAIEVLLQTVDRSDLGLERPAAGALARLGPRAAERLLMALVADEFMTLERRQAVLGALAASGAPGAAVLVEALRGRARGLAGELGVVLVRIGTPSVEPLVGLLSDPGDARLQGYAAFVLGELGPAARPALPALRAQAAHPDPAVQSAVAAAIARIEGGEGGPRGPAPTGGRGG